MRQKRKSLSDSLRASVYKKYNFSCNECGEKIGALGLYPRISVRVDSGTKMKLQSLEGG